MSGRLVLVELHLAVLVGKAFEVLPALLGFLRHWAFHVHLPAAPLLEPVAVHVLLLAVELQLVCEVYRRFNLPLQQRRPVNAGEEFVLLYLARSSFVAEPFLWPDLEESVQQ